ncbi:hypothetical protein NKG99_20535 [Mesorhizobium sp. M1409]|uniref:hypothetical protein n=1 Tax=Mesorhizobium sp. M1409 TaxID=2957100 RepID=UPI00333B789B
MNSSDRQLALDLLEAAEEYLLALLPELRRAKNETSLPVRSGDTQEARERLIDTLAAVAVIKRAEEDGHG